MVLARWSTRAFPAVLVLLAAALTACTSIRAAATDSEFPSAAMPEGRSTQTVTVGGVERTARLYRPAGLSEPAPLVVMLHGGYGSGLQAEKKYGWDAVADRERFIAVFPEGTGKSWNAGGGCCGPAEKSGVDDVAFIRQVVAGIRGQISIDERRIFVSGISNGGIMAYRLACETDLFAAVGVDAATMLTDCSGAAPVSVLHIHGTADSAIRYDGAPGKPYSSRSAPIDGPPVPAVNTTWRRIDDCAPPTTSTTGPVTTSTARCSAGRTVELISIAGAGHQWPGADPSPRLSRVLGTSTPSTAIDATEVIWQFFAANPG